MRFLNIFPLLLIVMIIGCSDFLEVNSPNTEYSNRLENYSSFASCLDTAAAVGFEVEPVWISLPLLPSITPGSNYTISKMIYNDKDDKIEIDTSYEGGIFGEVDIKLTLKFDKQILQQDSMLVMVELDLQNASIKFGPATIFNEPAMLDYKIKGLDFTLFDPYNLRFIYAGLNGIIEPVAFYKYEVKESEGSIDLKKGELPHFSRYGFVR